MGCNVIMASDPPGSAIVISKPSLVMPAFRFLPGLRYRAVAQVEHRVQLPLGCQLFGIVPAGCEVEDPHRHLALGTVLIDGVTCMAGRCLCSNNGFPGACYCGRCWFDIPLPLRRGEGKRGAWHDGTHLGVRQAGGEDLGRAARFGKELAADSVPVPAKSDRIELDQEAWARYNMRRRQRNS